MESYHRVLVTGASGFVGAWLVRALNDLSQDISIEILTAGRDPGCDVNLDIIDVGATFKLIRAHRPTAVIHLAAVAAPQQAKQDPSQAWNVNFQGTLNLANAVLSEAPNCRFIYAGSSEVYGQSFAQTDAPVDERCILQPMTIYGATKAAADLALGQMFFDGLRSIRFRPFNHSGPGQSDSYVIPAFAHQVAKIQARQLPPIIKVGNLSAFRDFVDVRDIVDAYIRAAMGADRSVEGKVFNLSSGRPVQIQAILDILIKLSGIEIEVAVAADRVRAIEIPSAHGDATAAALAFGWVPKIKLEDTVSSVFSDWKHRVSLSAEGF